MNSAIATTFFFLFTTVLNLVSLKAQSPFRHTVIITELYPDPDPASALPASEFIELKNISRQSVNLKGWKLTDGSSGGAINISIEIKPDSFLLICAPSAVTSLRAYGNAVGVTGFPSLNNDEDKLTLSDAGGQEVFYLHYELSWYRNEAKKQGGWTLEMIDPLNVCGNGGNWKASEDLKGGTPGSVNSVNAPNPDIQPPAALKTYLKDSQTIVVVFDEVIDSSSAANVLNYRFDKPGPEVIQAIPLGPGFSQVALKINPAPRPQTVYELTITRLTDCAGNVVGSLNKVRAGMSSIPAKDDIIINELLFNPRGSGYDYVELYNRSTKIINVKDIMFATPTPTGGLANMIAVSKDDHLLFPGDYLVVTENLLWLQQNYLAKDLAAVSLIADLPSLADDKGSLTVMDRRGIIIDDIVYSEKWHFALLNNLDGVALERINFNEDTNNKSNWTSASSAAGYGTPGYQNSQFRSDLQAQGSLVLDPGIFSPDNDGYQDLVMLSYQMEAPGFMGSITIYDASGRPVRYLVKSALLGMKGFYTWDGLDERQQRLPMGVYIIVMEVFDLKGRVKKIKNTLTLARKF